MKQYDKIVLGGHPIKRKPTHKGEYLTMKEEKERAVLRAIREILFFMPHRGPVRAPRQVRIGHLR